jgi:hypothetical protein
MGCCLLSEATIANWRVTVAPSIHQVHTRVTGQIQEEKRKDHPQCHQSPGHLTTIILSNDPRYGSHLAEDQGQYITVID